MSFVIPNRREHVARGNAYCAGSTARRDVFACGITSAVLRDAAPMVGVPTAVSVGLPRKTCLC